MADGRSPAPQPPPLVPPASPVQPPAPPAQLIVTPAQPITPKIGHISSLNSQVNQKRMWKNIFLAPMTGWTQMLSQKASKSSISV